MKLTKAQQTLLAEIKKGESQFTFFPSPQGNRAGKNIGTPNGRFVNGRSMTKLIELGLVNVTKVTNYSIVTA